MTRSTRPAFSRGACALAAALTIAPLAPPAAAVGAAAQVSGGAATDAALGAYAALVRSPAAATLLARARAAMERHWEPQDPGAAPDTARPIPWPGAAVAVYVSLVNGHATRACVGREGACFASLSEAVEVLAVEALASDRRRPPVRREELAGLRLVITFAGEGEPITDPMLADPGREGLSISTPGGFVGFLPGEARTVAWALREARRIGVLAGPVSAASYRRFPVVVLSEPEVPASAREALDEIR